MRDFRNKKGITLVALVVTIIVLLILAAVSINLVLGDNGIITRARQSKDETKKESAIEEVNLAWLDISSEATLSGKSLDEQVKSLKDELKKKDADVKVNINRVDSCLDIEYKKYPVNISLNLEELDYKLINDMLLTPEGNLYGTSQAPLAQACNLATMTPILENVKDATGSEEYGAAITYDGKVYTWGNNCSGRLGIGSNDENEEASSPICINDFDEDNEVYNKKIVKIIGDTSIIVLDENGKVYSWGNNTFGTLGNGTNTNSSNPICISDIKDNELYGKKIVELQKYNDGVMALDDKGYLYVWGHKYDSNFGDGPTSIVKNVHSPVCISNIEKSPIYQKKIIKYKLSNRTLMIDSNNDFYICGKANYNGGLGNGSEEEQIYPICLTKLEGNPLNNVKITSFAENKNTVALIDRNGKVYSWGDNNHGEIGNGTILESGNCVNIPVCISDISNSSLYQKKIVKMDYKYGSVEAVDDKGKIYVWGENYGRLSIGTDQESVLMPICLNDNENDMKNISIKKNNHIDENGNLYVWGKYCHDIFGITLNNDYIPTCVNKIEGSIFYNKKIVSYLVTDTTLVVDDQNNIYKMYVDVITPM